MEKKICPICLADKTEFYCEKNNFNLWQCLECNLVFVSPIPNNLDLIYSQDYFLDSGKKNNFGYSDYEQDKAPMKDVFSDFLNQAGKKIKGRKIFDIGAATGYFLDQAKAAGWQTAGIEISNYASKKAIEKGHEVLTGKLTDKEIKEKFNLVTMWDVLEHLDNPKIYLKKINQLLDDGGYLAINTIDKNSFWAKLWGKNWALIVPPEHLFFYSFKNLNLLLQESGFKIVETKKIGKKFSLSYIFKILYGWQKLKIYKNLSIYFNQSFWRKIVAPINLRDNIFIFAQKIKDV